MSETYEFIKMILSSPAVIMILTAAASLIPARMQITRDREKHKIAYENTRRDTYFQEKKKIYFDFLELTKKTFGHNNIVAYLTYTTELSKLEIFAPPRVRACATNLIPNLMPKGEMLRETFDEKSTKDAMIKLIKEQEEHPETEAEEQQRKINFSISLQILQNAMQEDLQEYIASINSPK